MFPEPLPRAEPSRYSVFKWPAGRSQALFPRSAPLPVDMVSLLEKRQTRRDFTKPLGNVALGEFLWLACRSRGARPSPYGPDQESRPHPSAGAMHPIHVLIAREDGPWERYDPVEHVLVELPGSVESAAAGRTVAQSVVSVGCAVVVGLVAEPGKTAAKYENPETLVWRDAGVVLGYMSLIAEALELSFCPLGVTGQSQFADLLPNPTSLHGVGLALLGAD